MEISTEENNDVLLEIEGNTNLMPEACIFININIEITKKNPFSKNRRIYILTQHPDIIWEIPILFMKGPRDIYVPDHIRLFKVPVNTYSYYQFIINNPSDTNISFSICSNYEDLNITPITGVIAASDYCKFLIRCKFPDKVLTSSVLITLNKEKTFETFLQMEPSNKLIYLSTNQLTFDETFMGLKKQKSITICNKSLQHVSFQWSCSNLAPPDKRIGDSENEDQITIKNMFTIKNTRGCIPAMSSVLSIINFTPTKSSDCNENKEPPFEQGCFVYLYAPILCFEPYQLEIKANIIGPYIEILPRETDVGEIYIGQIKCLTLKAINKGPIDGKISFMEHTDQNAIHCSIFPQSQYLKPKATAIFHIKFYRLIIGKFLTKLGFKIEFGNFVPIFLRGTAIPVKVNLSPISIEFGNIPICVPQKRFALITNRMQVPIVVNPQVIDEGIEDPMIFCIDFSKFPINARPKQYFNIESHKSRFRIMQEDMNYLTYSDFNFGRRTSSANESFSSISSIFKDDVLDKIPAIANNLLQNLKAVDIQNQEEPGVNLINTAMDCILDQSDYYANLKNYQNYLQMDWKYLPNDAKEVAIETELFYLEPNESKSFPITLIPNSSGPNTWNIQFKVCPLGKEHPDISSEIDSSYMITKLSLKYNCIVPVLKYNENIKFSQPIFVDLENIIYMKFKNMDAVPGFVYFRAIPKTDNGFMRIDTSKQKFMIVPNEEVDVMCWVKFTKVGNVTLHGMFQIVGKIMEYPFTVEADVLSPKIDIFPEKISKRQQVLESTRTDIILENICPTKATFNLSLKNEEFQYLEPLGGSLAPNQKIVISLFSRYRDPGVYKNIINIHLKHAPKMTVPVTFMVEGIPIKFEPNIRYDFNLGTIFKNEEFQEHLININNLGDKQYKLIFFKQKSKVLLPPFCKIEPKGITLPPKTNGIAKIFINTSNESTIEEEHLVDCINDDNFRFKLFLFTIKCNIIKPKIAWSDTKVCFQVGIENKENHKLKRAVTLSNITPLKVNVNLNVEGVFTIYNDLTACPEKSSSFILEGKESKEIIVNLDIDEINLFNKACECFRGLIKCGVNNKLQKPVQLCAKIVIPCLKICTPQVTFFALNADTYGHVNIQSCGTLLAEFNWIHVCSTIAKNELVTDLPELKTISENVLTLAENLVPKFPILIKSLSPEFDMNEDDYFESDEMDESFTTNMKTSQESVNLRNLSRESKNCKFLTSEEKDAISIQTVLASLTCVSEFEKTEVFNSNQIGLERKEETENFDVKTSIRFQQSSGYILPNHMHKSYMFLPPIPHGYNLNSKFHLSVTGGLSKIFDISVTNFKGRIHISKTQIDLGRMIWHKTISQKIDIMCRFPHVLKINLNTEIKREDQNLNNGFIKINSLKRFILEPEDTISIEWIASPGLQFNFKQDIGIEINSILTAIPIKVIGTGLIPMVIPRNSDVLFQNENDILKSYLAIKIFFQFLQEKNSEINQNTKDIEETHSNNNRNEKECLEHDFEELHFQNEICPKGYEIERFIETSKINVRLEESRELRATFLNYYKNCKKNGEFRSSFSNFQIKICRPIPWELSTLVLNIGEMEINESRIIQVELTFTGPEKIFLSVRTKTIIPGLTANFEESQNSSHFSFFSRSSDIEYLNKIQNKNNQKEFRPHSHDLNELGIHQRKNSPEALYKMKEQYIKMKKAKIEQKNPLILAEIFQTNEENLDGSAINLVICFTTTDKSYKTDQTIEEHLFVDVHHGTTLPISINGKIIQLNV